MTIYFHYTAFKCAKNRKLKEFHAEFLKKQFLFSFIDYQRVSHIRPSVRSHFAKQTGKKHNHSVNNHIIRFLNENNQAVQAVPLMYDLIYMRNISTCAHVIHGQEYESHVLAGLSRGSYYSSRESDTRLYSKIAYEYDFGRPNVVLRNNS